MMVIRPIGLNDLEGLMALAQKTGTGLTTLPANEDRLSRRIQRSNLSFAGMLDNADQGYVFVLEDSETGRIAGICGLEAALGLKEPWYNYRVGTMVHASQELGIYSQHETLFLSNDHTGYSELCSLFLDPDYRGHKNGPLLSKCRFMFMAQFPHLFSKIVIAEMRGYSDDEGRSPFWEALGRHFFSLDFGHADYLTGVGEKAFVAELMPKYPVYIDFLTPEAQAVIARTHDNTRPALAMLESEGLRYEGYVDIFDAGPTIQAYVGEVRAVKESRELPARIVDPMPDDAPLATWLVSNTELEHFRTILVDAPAPDLDGFYLTPAQAAALRVEPGQHVRFVTLSAKEGKAA